MKYKCLQVRKVHWLIEFLTHRKREREREREIEWCDRDREKKKKKDKGSDRERKREREGEKSVMTRMPRNLSQGGTRGFLIPICLLMWFRPFEPKRDVIKNIGLIQSHVLIQLWKHCQNSTKSRLDFQSDCRRSAEISLRSNQETNCNVEVLSKCYWSNWVRAKLGLISARVFSQATYLKTPIEFHQGCLLYL